MMISYSYLIVTYGLTRLLYENIRLKIRATLALTFQCHSKVKCDVTSGHIIYDIPLMFYSNIGPNSAPLRD